MMARAFYYNLYFYLPAWCTGLILVYLWTRESYSNVILSLCLLTGATTVDLPAGILYKVKASYKYQAEDVDELNFEVGEIIHVVAFDDPEEQVREVFAEL